MSMNPKDEIIPASSNDTKIILYTTHCPKCGVLKRKLDEYGVIYTEVDDVDELQRLNIVSIPVLCINGTQLNFTESIRMLIAVPRPLWCNQTKL